MKKVGVLYDNISGNVGDVAIGLSVKKILDENGIDYDELIPGNFNPRDYERIIIGGGYLLNPSPHFYYDKFRIPGEHILNSVGISGYCKDLSYLNDYKYLTVRSQGDKEKLSYLKKRVDVVPCTTMYLEDLPQCAYTPKKPSIGIHLFPCFQTGEEEASFTKWASSLPYNIYLIPITHYNQDYMYLLRLKSQIKNATLLPILNPLELFTFIGKLDYFISCSLHGAIFSYTHNVPYVLYNSQDKMEFFMRDRGLEKYLFKNYSQLESSFDDIVKNPPDYSKKIANDKKILDKHIDKITEILQAETNSNSFNGLEQKDRGLNGGDRYSLNMEHFQIQSLQMQAMTMQSNIVELESKLIETNHQKQMVEQELYEMKRSVLWHLMTKYNTLFVEGLLPKETWRRRAYDLSAKGMRIIANEGLGSFWRQYNERNRIKKIERSILENKRKKISEYVLEEWNEESIVLPETSDNVTVSIIIPVFNKSKYTYNCLSSIRKYTNLAYEVIIVNDASSDDTNKLLLNVKNARVITNIDNLGFIESCNKGASTAKGKYLLFLNNDTIVTEGWLGHLLRAIDKDNVGAAGAKLVYPNGKLQEAGSIIWDDASGWNYGRGDDPDKPEYNYVREVDYCSGAALMVKKDVFEKCGGFNALFKPAYYEDTDLCFSIRNMGLKVLYQPESMVIHFEGATSGTDTKSGVKRYQEVNRDKFREKWHDVLMAEHHPPDSTRLSLARSRKKGKTILVIDHYIPTFDKDSGSYRMYNFLKILSELGHNVTFIGDNPAKLEPYTSTFQQEGIEVIYSPYIRSIDEYLSKNGRFFDVVILSRAHIADNNILAVREHCSQAKIVFDTVDLQFLREERRARIEGNKSILDESKRLKEMEFRLMDMSDVTLVVSSIEKGIINNENDKIKVEIVSNIVEVNGAKTPFSERKDIMFIGGYLHPPNVDAVKWFVKDIFPIIRKKIPDVKFYSIGSEPPEDIKALASDDVVITGYVEDPRPYFDKSRVFVAPLRYGAGIKGKINQSMSYGLPVVTTTVGAEGMGLANEENVLIADDAALFAEKIIELYHNERLWYKLSANSVKNVEMNYSYEVAREKIARLINSLDSDDGIGERSTYHAPGERTKESA